eukprot:TRINITY_DN4267_c0_g1_i1.p1 TRINITY_DN4267_c0_g1~~TRINITY_DN4267_c0_g1_i1.p1  ORF type:complete len:905 (+),score=326.79 TRINITY_DN4267_c0_g1_i1:77-2716(+)
MAPKQQILIAGEQPPAKIAKTEPAEDEEFEKDAAPVKGKAISDAIVLPPEDSTLNIVPTSGGKVLMALADAGLQFLVAASRANVGVKKGRYMYEVRVMEVLMPGMPGGRTTPLQPIPRQQCRVGFSKQGSSLFLGETADSVCFDADGNFITNKVKTPVSERFVRDSVLGILLNLDPSSKNANTVSLFKDGRRVSKPQPLPEELKGHALFPHVAFRNVTLQLHFGPELMAPIPFKCLTMQEAPAADVTVVPVSNPQDAKYDVIFPIALPDEGTFDWLDDFLEKNPGYVELSDRKIIEWGKNSGLGNPRITSLKNCNDKPDVSFGIQVIDELTPRKLLHTVAPLIPRNYVVMEVKSNLVKAERKEMLNRFKFPRYNRIAMVVVGEPPDAWKAKVQAAVLAEKQEKVDTEWKAAQAEKARIKELEAKQKQLIQQRKMLEEAQKKAIEEAAAKAKAEAGGDAEMKEGDEAKEEGKEEEAKEEVKKEEDVEMKQEPEEPEETEPPKAELDDEEQKLWFLPRPVTDMASSVFNSTFVDFTLPDDEEDFTEIRYEWATELAGKEYMKSWMQAKKITTRVEELSPSEWFINRMAEWQRMQSEWQLKQKEFKSDPARQQVAARRLQKEKEYREKLDSKEKGDEEVKKEAEEEKEKKEEEEEKKEGEQAEAGKEEEEFKPLDIYTCEDVCDVGDGEPLFSLFTYEDWALMNLRFELLLIIQAFKKDVPDPDRPGVHESHLAYYYNRYFRKPLNVKFFGTDTAVELCELVKDAVTVKDNGVLAAEIPEEKLENLDLLVRCTEEIRRERQRRVDAGDESAKLKFSVLASQQAMAKAMSPANTQTPKAASQASWPGSQASGGWGGFGTMGKGKWNAFGALGGKGWGGSGFGW